MRAANDWMLESACRGLSSELFYPIGRPAKSLYTPICDQCPVKRDCLEYAILYDEHGVWGGTSENERKLLRPVLQGFLRRQAQALGIYEDRLPLPEIINLRIGSNQAPAY